MQHSTQIKQENKQQQKTGKKSLHLPTMEAWRSNKMYKMVLINDTSFSNADKWYFKPALINATQSQQAINVYEIYESICALTCKNLRSLL